jgi:hypothetical protein
MFIQTGSLAAALPARVVSGETAPAPFLRDLDYFDQEIRRVDQTNDDLRVAQLCAEAIQTLPVCQHELLIARLGVPANTFDGLVAVGNTAYLHQAAVRPYLPTELIRLWFITRLSGIQFAAALAEGVIHPEMWVRDLGGWLRKREGKISVTYTRKVSK